MSKYLPYIQRRAGDVATSDDWNRLQEMIREETRQHRHLGETADTNRMDTLGSKLGNASLQEGAVDEPAFADGAVRAEALQEQMLADWAIAADAQISEQKNLYFDVDAGHDHDGTNSSTLAKGSVGRLQIVDQAVTNDKLAPDLLDEIAEMELLLSIPQALFVSTAAGGSPGDPSYSTIVGHGFGNTPGTVRLLKLLPGSPGEYRTDPDNILTVEGPSDWTNNKIRVRLPEDPTGLFVVVVDGIPLNPLRFDESLVVTDAIPDHRKLDVEVNSNLQITFSTELLEVAGTGMGDSEDIKLQALYPGESTPRELVQNLDSDAGPLDLPIEIYYGDNANRLDAGLTLESDRKSITLTHSMSQLPWDTVFVIKVYGEPERDQKPVLVAANNQQPIQDAATEIRFTTQQKPPAEPKGLRVVPVVGRGGKVVSPENFISLANQHAVPIEITTDETNLPSDWIEIEISDGDKVLEERLPAIGGGEVVYVTMDTRSLEDGPIQIRARARNATNESEWTLIEGMDPATRESVDWVLKDTRRPFVRVHPVRSPYRFEDQDIRVDVEPGSTVTVLGGARIVTVRDVDFTGRVVVEVPLNPNTTNYLRVSAIDVVGNRSAEVVADRSNRPLAIVHDDKLPEIKLEPLRSPTRNRRVILKGTANEPVTVVATSGQRIASSSADLNRPFKIPFTLERNKTNYIRVVATDTAGNTSPPVVLAIRHDDIPPPLRLVNKGYYHRLSRASSARPVIVVRRTRIAISGYTEPGSTVILSGYGRRVTTQAKGNGSFTIRVPFRLRPTNFHHRHENRSWTFNLDAYDLSGNRTNQRKTVRIVLEYRIPWWIRQVWWWHWYWWFWWWGWYRWHWRGYWWFYDSASRRAVWYYRLWRHHNHWHWHWYNFRSWMRWI